MRQILINGLAVGVLTAATPGFTTWQFWLAIGCSLVLIINSMIPPRST